MTEPLHQRYREPARQTAQRCLLMACGVLAAAAYGCSHQAAETPLLEGSFYRVGVWERTIDGVPQQHASVWAHDDGFHYLLEGPTSNQLIYVATRRRVGLLVERQWLLSKNDERGEITLRLPAESKLSFPIRVEPQSVEFVIQGRRVEMHRAKNILGQVECASLPERLPEMKRFLLDYALDSGATEKLKARLDEVGTLRLKVYFGSWCPFSARRVPALLKLATELGNRLELTCIGIDAPVTDDPIARQVGLVGVPAVRGSAGNRGPWAIDGVRLRRPETELLTLVSDHQ